MTTSGSNSVVNVVVKALKALEQYPTPKSRQALTSTIENEKCFYLIRIDAAKSLAKVFTSYCCHIDCIVTSVAEVVLIIIRSQGCSGGRRSPCDRVGRQTGSPLESQQVRDYFPPRTGLV